MSSEDLSQMDTTALLRLVGAVVLFAALHLLRLPLVLLATVLALSMQRLSLYVREVTGLSGQSCPVGRCTRKEARVHVLA